MMEEVGENVRLGQKELKEKIDSLELEGDGTLSQKEARDKLAEYGFQIQKMSLEAPGKFSMLACDSSILKKELLYNCLWAAHTVTVYAEYDGERHADRLAGRGETCYTNMSYESSVKISVFKPYSSLDERLDSARVKIECNALLNTSVKPDVLLFDGSLHTCLKKNSSRRGYAEHEQAGSALSQLAKQPVIAQVEDTHSNDISKKLGYTTTDLLLFEIALEPMEYVEYGDDITVRYFKLPGKKAEYLDGKSSPLTLRWEYNTEGRKYFSQLASIWLMEDDLVHTQLYPLRIADYLTRKIKVGGILDKITFEKNLEEKHRNQRTI